MQLQQNTLDVNSAKKKKTKQYTIKMIWLKNKITMLISDASKLEQMEEKKLKRKKTKEYLIKKYHLEIRLRKHWK